MLLFKGATLFLLAKMFPTRVRRIDAIVLHVKMARFQNTRISQVYDKEHICLCQQSWCTVLILHNILPYVTPTLPICDPFLHHPHHCHNHRRHRGHRRPSREIICCERRAELAVQFPMPAAIVAGDDAWAVLPHPHWSNNALLGREGMTNRLWPVARTTHAHT